MNHAPVTTSEEAAKVRGRGVEEGLKRGAKAMILRSEGKFYQFVLPGHLKLDFKKAKQVLNTKSLSLASKEEVQKITDCVPGSVPPFGNLWNIPVIADMRMNDSIDFNAGLHETSITMSLENWKEVVNPVMADITCAS